ncbi:MAG: hypothetical protein H8M99_05385 [Gloeobacteraceae cyanobacterium ES-bin-144]|nr:hypothetical protein [Verrucomicrobiales bacterium]
MKIILKSRIYSLYSLLCAGMSYVVATAQEASLPSPLDAHLEIASSSAISAKPSPARVLGKLPDGTPPPPQPPKPPFIVAEKDVFDSVRHAQGGRTITIQEIQPIDLPPTPEAKPEVNVDSESFRKLAAAHREKFPAPEFIQVGASVYVFGDQPTRTLVTIRSHMDQKLYKFWSSADFSYLSGFSTFVGSDGMTRSMFMMWSFHYPDRVISRRTANAKLYEAPKPPAFPAEKVSFILVGDQPDEQTLASIQSLHDLYQNELPRLKAAYEGRERAQREGEAELKAHPPKPQDITLNYWRVTSTNTYAKKGGEQ